MSSTKGERKRINNSKLYNNPALQIMELKCIIITQIAAKVTLNS